MIFALMTSFESPWIIRHLMPILIALDNHKQRAPYLVELFVQVHMNWKENLLVFSFGYLNTTPFPHPCLH